MAINILFVCTGNTCRSPMAAGLLAHLIPEARKSHYAIGSAGIQAAKGLPATEPALKVMAEAGIDISGHRSQPVTKALLEKADLVLALSADHVEYLKERFPEAAGKTFLLSEYADKSAPGHGPDIADPVGAPMEIYRDTRDRIKKYAAKIVGKM